MSKSISEDEELRLYCWDCLATFLKRVPYEAKYVTCPHCRSRQVRVIPKGHKPLDLAAGRHYNGEAESGETDLGPEIFSDPDVEPEPREAHSLSLG